MRKDEVYSWRVSRETKSALEEASRRLACSVADLLESITRAWLEGQRDASGNDESHQARLQAAVRRTLGTISGGGSRRSEQVRRLVRERLTAARAR